LTYSPLIYLILNNIKRESSSSNEKFNIGCISCPTLFKTLNYYLKEAKSHPNISSFENHIERINIKLFEFDKRFEIYGNDFVFYDYKKPLDFDESFNESFDMLISDPPFFTEECQIKMGMTIKKIGKSKHKLIICTGMEFECYFTIFLYIKLTS